MTKIPTTKGTIRGLMTALVTPFRDGEVDFASMEKLVDRQIDAGVDWLVPCGTTGESPTLAEEEHERILETVIARAAGRRPVMAGTGTNNTATTIRCTRRAAELGASAALIVTPYYNRPTQEGLFRHYAAVAESAELPIVLYNVLVRTGVHLTNDTVVRLRGKFPHIVALKDASGTMDNVTDLLARCDIAILCGDDALTLPMMSLGAVGVISVLSNLVPALMKSLVDSAATANIAAARTYHRKVFDLAMGLARLGPNPVPIKTAMAARGMIREEFRLPLCPLDSESRTGVERLLRRHEITENAAK
jgi:4-hydroxy-tetrahydrodipicolinate synthase